MTTKAGRKRKMQPLPLIKAALREKRRYPFTKLTRFYDLVSGDYHTVLAEWFETIKPYLNCKEVPDWKTCRRLDFRKIRDDRLAWCIAWILKNVGNDGLRVKKSVFFRYLKTSEHSNIDKREDVLKTLVNSYIRQGIPPCI